MSDLKASLNEIEGTPRCYGINEDGTCGVNNKMTEEHKVQIQTLEEEEAKLKKILKANQIESSSVLKAKEDRHMKTAKTLEDLYERKIARGVSKIEKLNGQLRDA